MKDESTVDCRICWPWLRGGGGLRLGAGGVE